MSLSSRFLSSRLSLLALPLAMIVVINAGAAHAENERIEVTLDQAKIVRLPPNAQTLIIGNPVVADVTVLKSRNSMVLTGKGFGVTNLIALDAQGNPVAESTIEVRQAKDKVLVVQRGFKRETYSCVSECMPVVMPADDQGFNTVTAAGITLRNGLSSPQR